MPHSHLRAITAPEIHYSCCFCHHRSQMILVNGSLFTGGCDALPHQPFFKFADRSNSGNRILSASTWTFSACAATWPVCRAASYPIPRASWPRPAAQPKLHWPDWESSPSPPSTHWLVSLNTTVTAHFFSGSRNIVSN